MPEPRPTSFFLVERYLPVTDLDTLSSSVARVVLACADGRPFVRYVHSTYVPAEDTCFCVFEAPSAELVRAVNEVGQFGLDRIVSAIGLDAALASHP